MSIPHAQKALFAPGADAFSEKCLNRLGLTLTF
jgi:hypothetical protein